MEGFVIMIRKRAIDQDLPYDQVKTEPLAITTARTTYNKLQLDRVTVLRCNTKAESYEIVYLQEKNCKHPHIQSELNFKRDGRVIHRCIDCKEVLIPYKLCTLCSCPLTNGYDLPSAKELNSLGSRILKTAEKGGKDDRTGASRKQKDPRKGFGNN